MTADVVQAERGSKLPSLQRAFQKTAWVAGAFSLIVLIALTVNAVASRANDPNPPTRIEALSSRLNIDRQNKALLADLRKQDVWLRTQYVRSQRFAQTGAVLLLFGIGTFVGCLRIAEKLSRKLPMPSPDAPDRALSETIGQQRGVITLGLVLGGGLAVIATLSRHDTAASYVTGTTMPTTAPVAKEQQGTPLAVLPPPSASTQAQSATTPSPIQGVIPQSGPVPLGANTTSLVPLTVPKPPAKPSTVAQPAKCEALPADANWSMFRGSNGIARVVGVFATKLNKPLWKTPIPLPGNGSPVVWGDKVFLSGASVTKREVYAFDAEAGGALWTSDIPMLKGSGPMKQANDAGFAPATIAADAEHVVAVFVNGDVACLDHNGKPLWGRAFGTLDNNYGHASSPVLADGKLILQVDQGGSPEDGKSALYAVDPKTGVTLWQVKRPVSASWSTPLVLVRGGKPMVVTVAAPSVIAYDLADGKELWRTDGMMGEVAPSPTFGDGVVFATQMGAGLLAIDAGSGKLLWNSSDASLPDIASPAYANGLVFVAGPDGTFTALDTKTGKIAWEKKLPKVAKSSPVAVGDFVYVIDGAGTAHVVKAAGTYDEIATSSIGEPVQATPAFVGGRIYIRGEKSLICVGTP